MVQLFLYNVFSLLLMFQVFQNQSKLVHQQIVLLVCHIACLHIVYDVVQ